VPVLQPRSSSVRISDPSTPESGAAQNVEHFGWATDRWATPPYAVQIRGRAQERKSMTVAAGGSHDDGGGGVAVARADPPPTPAVFRATLSAGDFKRALGIAAALGRADLRDALRSLTALQLEQLYTD